MDNTNINKTLKSLESSYLNNEYQAVIDGFLAVKDQLPKGVFHYNLGTAFLKSGEIGAGRYHLELALKNGYHLPENLHNIKTLKNTSNIIDAGDNSFIEKTIAESVSASWDVVFLIVAIMFTIVNVFRKKIFKSLTIYITACLFLLVPIIGKKVLMNKYNEAVVVKEGKIFEGPSKLFETNFEIKSGTKILWDRMKDDWIFVVYPEALSGWVKKDSLALF